MGAGKGQTLLPLQALCDALRPCAGWAAKRAHSHPPTHPPARPPAHALAHPPILAAAAAARTNLPAMPVGIPREQFIVWEDTTRWPAAFRKQMEQGFSYDRSYNL